MATVKAVCFARHVSGSLPIQRDGIRTHALWVISILIVASALLAHSGLKDGGSSLGRITGSPARLCSWDGVKVGMVVTVPDTAGLKFQAR